MHIVMIGKTSSYNELNLFNVRRLSMIPFPLNLPTEIRLTFIQNRFREVFDIPEIRFDKAIIHYRILQFLMANKCQEYSSTKYRKWRVNCNS